MFLKNVNNQFQHKKTTPRPEAWQSHAGQARNFYKVDSGFSHRLFSNKCGLFGNAGLSGLRILILSLCADLALPSYPPGCSFTLSPIPKGPAQECQRERSNRELRTQASLPSLLSPDLHPCFPSPNGPGQGIILQKQVTAAAVRGWAFPLSTPDCKRLMWGDSRTQRGRQAVAHREALRNDSFGGTGFGIPSDTAALTGLRRSSQTC